VLLRLHPLLLVGVDHAEIVVRQGAAPLIGGRLVGGERTAIVLQRQRPLAADVGHDAEILFDLADQEGIATGELERVAVLPFGLDQVAPLERESGKGVAGIRGQVIRLGLHRDVAASAAELPRDLRLGPEVVQNGKPPQCFRPNPGLFSPRSQIDDRRVALHGLGRPAAQVVAASFAQQLCDAVVAERVA